MSLLLKIMNYSKQHKDSLFVVFICSLAVLARVMYMNNVSHRIVGDEALLWYYANQKSLYLTIVKSLDNDLLLPLYHCILHIWVKIFNSHELARYCSLLISFPLVPLSFYLSKRLFNRITGYIAAILPNKEYKKYNSFCGIFNHT